jgi:dipeptide transport system ATP-binding protein
VTEERHAVVVRDLTVVFPAGDGRSQVLRGVSFDVRRGEILGIVGQSGAGKSVLIRALVNHVPWPGRILGGSVHVFGRDLRALSEEQIRDLRGGDIGVVVQNARSHLNPVLPIGEQIANVFQAHRSAGRREALRRAVEALRIVGIPAPEERIRAYPHELSGGMAQRAIIATALVCEPRLVLADEPTSGLDVTIQDQVLRLFRKLVVDVGAAALLVTRDMGIVANFCDRVGVMYKGELVEVAGVPEIFYKAAHPHTRRLVAAASLRDEISARGG